MPWHSAGTLTILESGRYGGAAVPILAGDAAIWQLPSQRA